MNEIRYGYKRPLMVYRFLAGLDISAIKADATKDNTEIRQCHALDARRGRRKQMRLRLRPLSRVLREVLDKTSRQTQPPTTYKSDMPPVRLVSRPVVVCTPRRLFGRRRVLCSFS